VPSIEDAMAGLAPFQDEEVRAAVRAGRKPASKHQERLISVDLTDLARVQVS
jgi:hypothetical protein